MKREIRENQALEATLLHFEPTNFRIPKGGNTRDAPNANAVMRPREPMPTVKQLDDGSVQFIMHAPDAKSVQLLGAGAFHGEYEMEPIGDDYFRVVVKDLRTGIMSCRFRVDGVVTSNQQMPFAFTAGEPINIFEVVDDDCSWYLLNDVPHGEYRMHLYDSKITDRARNCWVYTPPGYDQNPDKTYPVLYLQHGAGECESGWIDVGKVMHIMDNLLAEKKCEEMLVVMNSDYCFVGDETSEFFPGDFTGVLVDECMPVIEELYRVRKDRESRAIAGLSMGSGMAFRAFIERIDLFAWLGMFIGGLVIKRAEYDYTDLFENHFDELCAKTKLFFAANGEEEPTSKTMPIDMDALGTRGMNTEYHTYPGGHEITVCRKSLRDFAQKLFR